MAREDPPRSGSRPARPAALELWGGVECTVNRIGDAFLDQSCLTGHHDRLDDLDRLASLGIRALRFPVLWERVSPDRPDAHDWRWTDARLARLRALGVRPIAGLVHHGSGPRYTSLLDPGFAEGLACHAAAAAARYPWIEDWTPANEPLTTARFSALYGHWYPHLRDEAAFWTALLNQIEGVRLAMRAIRAVNPAARLIQTDDLGRTWATGPLAQQAAFDNVRRWMGWDLLCGRVGPDHPLWDRLADYGLADRLRAIADEPCPPEVIGINHYPTSDRFLDHRVDRYPPHLHGGNAQVAYADVEAVRIVQPRVGGLASALDEAWERYGIPLAITEVHLGCTREEQLRWLAAAWQTALDRREHGIDVRAVTGWALFGNQGWNTLLTGEGRYEAGAWDVRGPVLRETSLARLYRSLAAGEPAQLAPPLTPALGSPGWWDRPARLLHEPAMRPAPLREHFPASAPSAAAARSRPPLLILGATGTLGQALAHACAVRDLPHRLLSRQQLDLASPASIAAALDDLQPWAVLNAAGWVRVDDAESAPGACMAANAVGAVALARACEDRGVASISFSSDLVFGADPADWYFERDRPAPLNVYGRSKSQMEDGVLALGGRHLVIRTAAFFSPADVHNFAVHAWQRLSRGETIEAADCVVSPSYVPDLCHAALDLLIDGEHGIWHLSNGEAVSWAAFATRIADACGLDGRLVQPVSARGLGWIAPRPERCALASERGSPMPSLDDAIERFAEAVRHV